MTASIICFVVNVICDHTFIVLFSWDTFGLGLATSVSEWVFLIVLAMYYILGKSEWRFSLKGCEWADAPKIVTLGYSGALCRFVEMFRCLIVNYLILRYIGSVGISSFAASNSVMALFWPIPYGIMAVGRMLFSISLGEEDRRSLVDIMKIISVVLPIVDGLIGVAVCSFFLIPTMHRNGLYISNILNGVICATVIMAGAWLSLKHFPKNMEDIMAIPDRIGVSPDERIDISVTNEKEVLDVSVKIDEFCRRLDIDRRRAFFSSLCMEEMAGNIVRHGFSLDNKKHSVDIRVVHKDDEIILRIRDNCSAFDPSEYHNVMKQDKKGGNIGISLVYGIAKKVEYQNLLGMNVLTIRL